MKPWSSLFLMIVLVTLLSACGPLEVRSVPPGLSLESVTVVDEQLRVNLRIENRNDNIIVLESIDLKMLLGETTLFEHASPTRLEIDPRGRELLQLTLNAQYNGLDLLTNIETSQAYRLDGKLQFVDLRDYPVRLQGFLHPVPGQPGRYR